jgi:LysM repeat protein
MEDYFADAADRLRTGEPIEQILAGYPDGVRQELYALLAVVELAERMATVAPPQRVPLNRIATRVAFSKRAAELRTQMEAAQPLPVAAPARPTTAPPTSQPTSQPAAQPNRIGRFWRELSAAWRGIGAPSPLMRLAPLSLLLISLYLSTFTVVATAQAALPGDLAYPMKSWIREQRVATTPVEQQAFERWRADQAQAEDVAARAGQLQSEANAQPLTAVSMLQFRGFDGEQLLIGDLKVIPWHRPEGAEEIAQDEWLPIEIDGELEPGAVVMLRYQIVPGASDAVQGIALRVMQTPAMPTPAPTPTPTPGSRCQRIQAPNWVAYVVKQGETLSEIAVRAQTSSAELRRVNCLTDGGLRAGSTIFVPATILGSLPTAAPPILATAIAPPAATITATPAAPTSTPSPPTSAPTITPTGTETQGGGSEVTPESTPGGETSTATPSAGTPATETPTAAAPTAGATSTDAPGATSTPTPTPESGTPAASATATSAATPEATATSDATTAAPEPTALPPTAVPPTAAPPTATPPPPTAVPPTAPPPTPAPTVAPAAAPTTPPEPTSDGSGDDSAATP